MARADAVGSPPSTSLVLTTFASPRSTSWAHHYSRVKSAKSTRYLVGFSAHDQLSCDNHYFSRGYTYCRRSRRPFITVSIFRRKYLEGCQIIWKPFRKTLLVRLLPNLKGSLFLKSPLRYFKKWQKLWR